MTTFISKSTINRLLKDVKQIIKNPLIDQGIYYVHDDTDMLKGYAMIVGPSDTPYFGGFYFFKFVFPSDYPHSPPTVTYCTNGEGIRFNPNLYICGKVCVSLLNTWRGDQWTSCQTISTVLLTLCTLLCDNPLLNEPGVPPTHPEINKYTEIVTYGNFDVAICNVVCKKGGYMPFFDLFYPFVTENFKKNYESLVKIAENKLNDTNVHNTIIKTGFYGMNIYINYEKVIERLKETKEICV